MLKHRIYYTKRIISTSFRAKRILNFFKLQLSYALSRFGILVKWSVYPMFASVEPTNICNLHCPECPVGVRTITVKRELMSMIMMKKIVGEIADYSMHLIMYFQGEPLLNSNFSKIVKIANENNLLTSTSTNAQLIDNERAKEIVECGLDRLIISIDGTTQQTYETYRVGGKLTTVLKAIELITDWRKKLNSSHPFIELQFLVLKTNEHQMNDMKQLAKELKVEKLTFKTAQIYDYENGSELLTTIDKYSRYRKGKDGKYYIKNRLENRCKRLWFGCVFNSKGEVLPCCFDKDSSFSFGNINDSSLSQIWHNSKSQKFRKSILIDRKQYEMCRNCSEK